MDNTWLAIRPNWQVAKAHANIMRVADKRMLRLTSGTVSKNKIRDNHAEGYRGWEQLSTKRYKGRDGILACPTRIQKKGKEKGKVLGAMPMGQNIEGKN